MVLINKAINEITVKLVYYGPGLCGKTTNLEKIYSNPKLDNKGKMISMSTETDRTLFFDFMPMELGTIAGQKVRVQLYTVPGQVFYDATRKLVLRGADGVVFVADSQQSMHESNLDSLLNLRTNLKLNRIDPQKVAMVFQYNKRDLPNVDSVDEMTAYLHPGNAAVVEASAITGVGVTATLRAAVTRILDNLKNNVDTVLYDEPELQRPDMSVKAGVTNSSAGSAKLSMKNTFGGAAEPVPTTPAPSPEPARRTLTDVPTPPRAAAPSPAQTFEPEEDDPFGEAEDLSGHASSAENPFAAPREDTHDASPDLPDMSGVLEGASEMVRALEQALDRARAHEQKLKAALAKG